MKSQMTRSNLFPVFKKIGDDQNLGNKVPKKKNLRYRKMVLQKNHKQGPARKKERGKEHQPHPAANRALRFHLPLS